MTPSLPTFHHREFRGQKLLLREKQRQGLTLSVVIPTLDEAATIGKIVTTLLASPLVDELVVVDSGSTDDTRTLAAAAGAAVHLASDIRPDLPPLRGKGENLWKSLHVTRGDLVVFIDGDLTNIHPRFLYGLAGPLIRHPGISYVKAFYDRPGGGGRVTELLVRPLLEAFYPPLAAFRQPLAGEYAARRTLLETLPFPSGYEVETTHLIDIFERHGLAPFAQVDLSLRRHRNRPLSQLGPMAAGILNTVLHRLHRAGRLAAPPAAPAGPEREAIAHVEGMKTKDSTCHAAPVDFAAQRKAIWQGRKFSQAEVEEMRDAEHDEEPPCSRSLKTGNTKTD